MSSDPDKPDQDSNDSHQSAERKSFLELTRQLAGLPLDHAAAALESSAAISSISLRAGIEFLRAAPAASQVLQSAELKSWAELGRRLAMGDYETAVTFFATGVESYKDVPQELHADIFQLCVRQMTLSTAVGRETFQAIPAIVIAINDTELFTAVISIATEIARRSAKHSADFLKSSADVAKALKANEKASKSSQIKDSIFSEFEAFVKRLQVEYLNKKKIKTNNGK